MKKNVWLRRFAALFCILIIVLPAIPVFAEPTVALTFDVNGHGEINISGFTYKTYTIEIPKDSVFGSVSSWSVVDQGGEYSFDGWWTDPVYGEKFIEGVPIASDLKLYAHWHTHTLTITGDPAHGTVTIDGMTVTGPTTLHYCDGRTATVKATATAYGYDFWGWMDGDGKTITVDNPFIISFGSGYADNRYLEVDFRCGHYDLVHVSGKLPTCEKEGIVEHWECPTCGKYFYTKEDIFTNPKYAAPSDVILPKTGHSMTYYAKVDPTCTTDGMTEHYVCSECHKCFYDAAGTQDAGSSHEALILKATGHKWEEKGTVTKQPTETEEGEMTYHCVNDPSHTKTEPIPKLTPSPTITPEAVPSTVPAIPTGAETPTPTVTAAPSPTGTGSSAESIAPTETPKVVNGGGSAEKNSAFRTFMAKYWAIPVLCLIIMVLLVLIGIVLGRMRNDK